MYNIIRRVYKKKNRKNQIAYYNNLYGLIGFKFFKDNNIKTVVYVM